MLWRSIKNRDHTWINGINQILQNTASLCYSYLLGMTTFRTLPELSFQVLTYCGDWVSYSSFKGCLCILVFSYNVLKQKHRSRKSLWIFLPLLQQAQRTEKGFLKKKENMNHSPSVPTFSFKLQLVCLQSCFKFLLSRCNSDFMTTLNFSSNN